MRDTQQTRSVRAICSSLAPNPSSSVDPPGIEPGSPVCRTGVFPLDHEPDRRFAEWTRPWSRTHHTGPCKHLSVSDSPPSACRPMSFERSVRELNPVLLLNHTRQCGRNTYRPNLQSDPGRNRTVVLLDVGQASLPLDHGIVLSVTRVGVEPTKSPRSQRDRFACLRTWSYSSSGSGGCTRRSEYMKLRWTLVHPRQLQAPVSNRAHRPYDGQLGACPSLHQ